MRLPQFHSSQLLFAPIALISIAGWLYLIILIIRNYF